MAAFEGEIEIIHRTQLAGRIRPVVVSAGLLLAAGLATVPAPAQAATTYVVDDDGAQCAGADFTTIQDAVGSASAGDTIQVCAGTYAPTTVSKPVTINGPQAGVDARTGRTDASAEATIDAAGANVALVLNGGGITLDGVTVTGASSGSGDAPGIVANGGGGTHVVNTIIAGNQRAAYVDNDGTAPMVFSQDRIDNSYDGIFGGNALTDDLRVVDNAFTHNPEGAVGSHSGAQHDWTISGNTQSDGGNFTVLFGLEGGTIADNTVSGGLTGYSVIYLGGGNDDLTITGNSVSGAGGSAVRVVSGFGAGPNHDLVLNDNLLDGTYGVRASGDGIDGSLSGTCNTIAGNTAGGVDNASSVVFDLARNYWGAASGPSGQGPGTGDSVSANVSFRPWATNAACSNFAPAVSAAPGRIAEGNSGTRNLVFRATLSQPSPVPVVLSYATSDGTAHAGSDYVAATGTVTFAPGTTTQAIGVIVKGDTTYELAEKLSLELTGATNAAVSTPSVVGTIANDDAKPSLSISDVAVTEGNAGLKSATFTITLSAASAVTSHVRFGTDNGTATSTNDYVARSGGVTFAPGETSKQVVIQVRGDRTAEGDETFEVDLSNPAQATVADPKGVGSILNDD